MNKLVQINIHGLDKEITCAFKTPYGMTNAFDMVSTVLDAVEQSADESSLLPEAVAECIQNCMEIDFEETPEIFNTLGQGIPFLQVGEELALSKVCY